MSTLDQYSPSLGTSLATNRRKEVQMSYRTFISIAAAAVIGVLCISTEALAYRAVYRGGGVHVGGVYRGGVGRVGVYHGAYARRGVGLYNGAGCGYAPYPPC